jgi:hypothetical protein
MAVAPTVIAGDILADDGRYIRASVRASVRGELVEGAIVLIDLKKANRDRDDRTPAAELSKGRGYLLLLRPSSRKTSEPYPLYDLVRAAAGVKAIPLEGSPALIDAAVRLGAVQARHDDDYLWATLPTFLEDGNPVLVDAALDLYVKFRRESINVIPAVQPLLEHPRPDFRQRAALLLGRALVRYRPAEVPERPELVAELTGRARRDEEPAVRREATAALAGLPDAGIDETLRAIARDDPDQNVRFEAEKSLSSRATGAVPKRSD